VLAKEIVFVIPGQFSRGKEIREQEYCYETNNMLILIGKRLGQSPSRKYWSSTKCKALFYFRLNIFAFVSTSMGTKRCAFLSEGRRFKGAPQPFVGQLPQTAFPGFATVCPLLHGYKCLC